MSLDAITDKVLPDEADQMSMRRWRLRIAAVACSNWLFTFCILVPFLIAVLFIGAPVVGQVVWESEKIRVVRQNDQEQKVAELKSEVKEVKEDVSRVKSNVDTILKLSLEQRIREVIDETCGASPTTRRILEQNLSDLQNDYFQLTGHIYRTGQRCREGNG